jgi:hypothetical protein
MHNKCLSEYEAPHSKPAATLFTKRGRALLASLGIDAVSQMLQVMAALDRRWEDAAQRAQKSSSEERREKDGVEE